MSDPVTRLVPDVVADADLSGGSGCVHEDTTYGVFERIAACPDDPNLFWRVIVFGPIEFTTPLFDLYGPQHIRGFAEIDAYLHVHGHTEIDDYLQVHEHAEIDGYLQVHAHAEIDGYLQVHEHAEIDGYLQVHEHAEIDGYLHVHEHAEIDGYLQVHEHAEIDAFCQLLPRDEPPPSPRPPLGPPVSLRLWYDAALGLRTKRTFWPLLEDGSYADEPEITLATLAGNALTDALQDQVDALAARVAALEAAP
jgi:hypothetical protein